MLDFFWFRREVTKDPKTGLQHVFMAGQDMGGIRSDRKTAHRFVVSGRAANDAKGGAF